MRFRVVFAVAALAFALAPAARAATLPDLPGMGPAQKAVGGNTPTASTSTPTTQAKPALPATRTAPSQSASTADAAKSIRSLPYVSSPLFYNGRVYTVKNGGLASCYDARTGQPYYQDERLGAPGDYYSSAVAVDGRIYLASQNGVMLVLAAGDRLDVLARNSLGEQVMATPAIVDGRIYVRTAGQLYAFGNPAEEAQVRPAKKTP